jgi:AAA+ superfamily predicted ATPase
MKNVPDWFPPWAGRFSELYYSGVTAAFVLYGNVPDLVRLSDSYGSLVDFLAEQIFGRWDLVLYYDLARGLRVFAGRDASRLKEMAVRANAKVGDLAAARKDPVTAFALLDRFVQNNIMAEEGDRVSAAILIDHASFLMPSGEPGRLSPAASTQVVTFLNWAASPHVKKLNMAMALIDDAASALNERITGNPYVVSIEVPLPDEKEREEFIRHTLKRQAPLLQPALLQSCPATGEFTEAEVAKLTAGLSLVDLEMMLQSQHLDAATMRALKKDLIERQCRGLVEFIPPKWNLDVLVGHEPVKQRLREDAALLRRGEMGSMPMGYLVCGPVGTGKSFLAQCLAGEIGVPCLMLKNFRSKYVGETEANLERVLGVLRAMGPVVVVIDEADAALGDRDQGGDSGTSSRVFSMIAAQMGDTNYRGRILWMLLTCRPDLLPIDLKRQGRAEVHIPLFYPATREELRAMFVAMARKSGAKLAAEGLPEVTLLGQISGADVEGIVTRALRRRHIQGVSDGAPELTSALIGEVLNGFLPSVEGIEKEMQEIAAILECSDREFLPGTMKKKLDVAGGREALQQRFVELRRFVQLS